MRLPPLLRNKLHKRAVVFTPQNLLREATRQPVLCLAHVRNCMAKSEGDFEKGEAEGSVAVLGLLAGIAEGWGGVAI
jgi:hypothetical protein